MTHVWPQLTAALVAGVLGSAHCLGMCAGISGLYAVNASARAATSQLPMALTYNLGRLLSYAVLGAAVGLFGGTVVQAIPRLAGPVRLVSGAVIVLIGLQIAFNWRILQPLEAMGAVVWQKVSPAAKGLLPVTTAPRALALGLLWGLLPCGLVYSMLLIAATSADAADGSLIMLAFGIGTTPAMVMTGIGALQLSRLMSRRNTRLGAGLLIVIVGVLTLAMPVSRLFDAGESGHMHHQQPSD